MEQGHLNKIHHDLLHVLWLKVRDLTPPKDRIEFHTDYYINSRDNHFFLTTEKNWKEHKKAFTTVVIDMCIPWQDHRGKGASYTLTRYDPGGGCDTENGIFYGR